MSSLQTRGKQAQEALTCRDTWWRWGEDWDERDKAIYERNKKFKKLTIIDTAFCNPYDSGPHSLMMLNSKTQGWFKAHLEVKFT